MRVITALEVFSWGVFVALVAAFIWGFTKSRNIGFLLLLIGTAFAAIARLAFPALISLSVESFPNLPLEDRVRLLTAIPGLIGSVVTLIGALLLAAAWPRAIGSRLDGIPEAPQP